MDKFFLLLTETAGSDGDILAFVQSLIGGVTSKITLAQVGTIIAAVIGAGIVGIFAWKFGRKGYDFIKNALSGKQGKI